MNNPTFARCIRAACLYLAFLATAVAQTSYPGPVRIYSAPPPAGVVGVPYDHRYSVGDRFQLCNDLERPWTFSVTEGELPPGLSLYSVYRAGQLSGTPTVPGTYTGTISATHCASTAFQAFSIVIAYGPPIVTGAVPPGGSVGASYAFAYTATGTPPITYSVTSGALPDGLALSASGQIGGTPTTAGTFAGAVTASNGIAPDAVLAFSIVIAGPAPVITSGDPPEGRFGTPYTFAYSATGTPPITYSVTVGALPDGLTLGAAGLIEGTPTRGGTFEGTVTASNGIRPDATQPFRIVIADIPPVITRVTPPFGFVGTPYVFTYSAVGSRTISYRVTTGALPPGLDLSVSGILAGTPTTAGTYTGTVAASNGVLPDYSQSFSIVVASPDSHDFLSLDAPGASNTELLRINASGLVMGSYYEEMSSSERGFLYSGSSYTRLERAGSIYTLATDINDSGQVVGMYGDGTGRHGFLYHAGAFASLDHPGAASTEAVRINGRGDVALLVRDFDSVGRPNTTHGSLYSGGFYTVLEPDPVNGHIADINDSGQAVGNYESGSYLFGNGTATRIDPPGATSVYTWAIDDSGRAVGIYLDAAGQHGFLYDSGSYTRLDCPGARSTQAERINASGQVAGYCQDAEVQQGFLYTDGTFTRLVPPGALTSKVMGINARGQVVGTYQDASAGHGFLYDAGTYTIMEPPAARSSSAIDINDSGQVIGSYEDWSFTTRGFLATPRTPPPAIIITSNSPPGGTVGVVYAFTIAATGAAPLTFSVTSGALPPGMTLSAAGSLSGIPTTAGTWAGTVTASNGVAPDATQGFSIRVSAAAAQPGDGNGVSSSGGGAFPLESMLLFALAAGLRAVRRSIPPSRRRNGSGGRVHSGHMGNG